MNAAARKRLIIVALIIVIVAIVLLAVIGSGGAAASISVAEASSGEYDGKKVEVSGAVVQDSYQNEGTATLFEITDDDSDATLTVSYTGAMPTTFGNGVTAICTGTIDDGLLTCTEMLTKCPSKYESAEGSLTVSTLLSNAGLYEGVELKLAGYITTGSLADINADVRFNINSQGSSIDVIYDGALPDDVQDGTAVILTGALAEGGQYFVATDLAIDSSIESQS